ncbi:septum site-determining protein MinC [Desulfofundulus thermosubterraneus]|uniref:Probable septum site-determining protein MinC n=1 Tax=Desulfofundulus thermosubterraneus DSM 16057 TaxID=1121432 RepID=A0A1M6LKW4_9FIRM|nr:septum site-determining protein MinC [Desulfofundulus thermosubterraneus]SHJ71810.1 septum site-determining protein MinC [Desulfofundulus thermosubterraneus DSM 16057]
MPRELVSIKGTREGLVILLDPNREFEDIKLHLKRKMESSRGFFRGARFTVYGQAITGYQRTELENICRQYGLIPSPEISWPFEKKFEQKKAVSPGEPARLVQCVLRSGQEIRHRGSVVIVGNVHPGAQVIAGGSVIIMGSCRGTIHAGAWGNNTATITALKLQPIRLSIAGVTADPTSIPQSSLFPVTARLEKGEIIFGTYCSKATCPVF